MLLSCSTLSGCICVALARRLRPCTVSAHRSATERHHFARCDAPRIALLLSLGANHRLGRAEAMSRDLKRDRGPATGGSSAEIRASKLFQSPRAPRVSAELILSAICVPPAISRARIAPRRRSLHARFEHPHAHRDGPLLRLCRSAPLALLASCAPRPIGRRRARPNRRSLLVTILIVAPHDRALVESARRPIQHAVDLAVRSSTAIAADLSRPTTPYSLCDLHDPFASIDGPVQVVSLPPTPPLSPKRRARSTTSSSTLTSASTYSTDSHRPPLPYRPGTAASASSPLIPIVTITPPPSPVRQHVRQPLERHHTSPLQYEPRRPFDSMPPAPAPFKVHATIPRRGQSASPRVRPRADSRPPSIDLVRRGSTRSWLIDTSASLSSIGRTRPSAPDVPAPIHEL